MINSPVRLSVDSGFVFCAFWPRTGANNRVVQYDSLVTLQNSANICKINNTCKMKNIAENSIVIVEPVDAKTVSVSLFCRKGAEDFDHNLTEVAREMKRERVSGYLSIGCIVTQGCLIQPKEFRNNHSSPKGYVPFIWRRPPTTAEYYQSLQQNHASFGEQR